MFPDPAPRLFALPSGVDFGAEVVAGLARRMEGATPADWARVTVFVNTRRTARRLREVFDAGPARLLPRIRLITDLALDPVPGLPLPVAPLRRRFELTQLIAQLLDRTPDLAPRTALYDLSDSLAGLLDEMQGEGVGADAIAALDVTDLSGHWERSLQFLSIVQQFTGASGGPPDREARQRQVIERLAARWATDPPDHPVIVAGSTGSRGATALFLQAVARLPKGAVILPGFDFDMPAAVWDRLDDALTGEDHPQFRFRRLMDRLELAPGAVQRWTDTEAHNPARNALVSLSLRPAPVTDQWLSDGPALGPLAPATSDLTLVEAPSPRAEAEAIALRMRLAVDEGITAALITADRMLTRQVAAALDRWQLTPDDSAGQPLLQSPPGRLLRQVARLFGDRLTAEGLVSLLKHPLVNAGARGPHILLTNALEIRLRRKGPPFPDARGLRAWAKSKDEQKWAEWIAALIEGLEATASRPLADHLQAHLGLAEALVAGPSGSPAPLWAEAAGRKARALCDEIALHADAAGAMDPRDYASLFDGVLATAEVRDRDRGHPQVLIWGTLEARVQGADLIILGGMNEGTWPSSPAHDPWLNRRMRKEAGLLLPERRIGLAAHDYAQAVAGREVWITRSIRSADAQTVPSRWLNRLTNLLDGLPGQGGPDALAAMKARGDDWLARAAALSVPKAKVPALPRPSPRPPVAARPRQLSVTRIGTLLRDPYAIYGEHVLRLKKLDPLTADADALLRGTILHRFFELFIKSGMPPTDPGARDTLLSVAEEVLAEDCPWPTVRRLWLARLERVADWVIETEVWRQALATPTKYEERGKAELTDPPFTLTCTADRIDVAADGSVLIYDYKTGKPPSAKEQAAFEKQLLLEAAIAEQGGFAALGKVRVQDAAYIGVGTSPAIVAAPLADHRPERVWAEFTRFMARWADPAEGYTARRAIKREGIAGQYDHLARFGEWDASDDPAPEDLA
ncbi:MAG: double-strand break repair protein AddB [Rubellimicrobium sp.]|nr:double-strand break repair protein AddB [Rubellimicrobium sp.]